MDALSIKLVKYLYEKGSISEEEIKIYEFGIERFLSFLINILTICVIGLIFGNLLYMLVFTIFYMTLQRYAGGFHADTKLKCYIYSTGMALLVSALLTNFEIGLRFLISMLTVSVLLLLAFGPVDNNAKHMDELEQIVYTKRMQITLLFQVLLLGGVLFLNYTEVAEYMVLAIVFETSMNILGSIKNRVYI